MQHCSFLCSALIAGYKVITFKNPYLGNTCVPFQHWACSQDCAQAIEIPARLEQIAAARELDRQYDSYIRDCQKQYHVNYNPARKLVRRSVSSDDMEDSESEDDIDSITRNNCHCTVS